MPDTCWLTVCLQVQRRHCREHDGWRMIGQDRRLTSPVACVHKLTHTHTHTQVPHIHTTQIHTIKQADTASRYLENKISTFLSFSNPICHNCSFLCIKTNSRTREVLTDTVILWFSALTPNSVLLRKQQREFLLFQDDRLLTTTSSGASGYGDWPRDGHSILPHPIRFLL